MGRVGRAEDLTGKRFGKLTVIERGDDYIAPYGHRYPMWKCKCDCGKVKNVLAGALKSGNVKSCGCSKRGRYIKKKPAEFYDWFIIKRNLPSTAEMAKRLKVSETTLRNWMKDEIEM